MHKICSTCSRLLSLENYSKRKGTPDGLNGRCKECIKTYMAKQHLERRNRPENIEKRRLRSAEVLLRKQNKVSTFDKKKYNQHYRSLNREHLVNVSKERYNSLKDDPLFKLNEKLRKSEFYYLNKDKYRAREAKRNFMEKTAKLKCLSSEDLEDIRIYYFVSKELSKLYGIGYNVDHIVPLNNKLVCGLHVPWNLKVLTEKENKSKGNKFNEEFGIDYSAEWYRKYGYQGPFKT